jgi:signal transduction histidine kinase
MSKAILNMEVRLEHDVVLARQRARQIAGLLGFDSQDQTRIATAVSEIARNAFQYAAGAKVEFLVDGDGPQSFLIRVRDHGPGIKDLKVILDGQYRSATGMGLGLIGVRRLMDAFQIDSEPGAGTTIVVGKAVPKRANAATPQDVGRIADELARRGPQNPFEEVQRQNQDLLETLDELRKHEVELTQANDELRRQREALFHLNHELDDTNRGVLALYAELDEKADYLRRASETKSRFLSNMSHEFRTPLNTIQGLGRLLLDRYDGDLATEQEKQVTLMCKAAEGLTELVNDLLDLAKVEAGRVMIRAHDFDISALFGALRGMLRPLLTHNSRVELIFDEPSGMPTLHTDESKVSQILRNFISNALKFTEKGEVRVSAVPGPDNSVIFSVADTGLGIPREDYDRVFQEFTQLDNSRQKYVKGTGLGLPLVKKLAELLGGRVTLESEVGVGSVFSAVLPCVYSGPGEVAVVSDAITRVDPGSQESVLLIDDDEAARYLLKSLLPASSYRAIEATSGTDGLRKVREHRPNAIILDLEMPDLSGYDVLAMLKADPDARETPVIICTSQVLESANRDRVAAAAAILPKAGLTRESVTARLREVLGHSVVDGTGERH